MIERRPSESATFSEHSAKWPRLSSLVRIRSMKSRAIGAGRPTQKKRKQRKNVRGFRDFSCMRPAREQLFLSQRTQGTLKIYGFGRRAANAIIPRARAPPTRAGEDALDDDGQRRDARPLSPVNSWPSQSAKSRAQSSSNTSTSIGFT